MCSGHGQCSDGAAGTGACSCVPGFSQAPGTLENDCSLELPCAAHHAKYLGTCTVCPAGQEVHTDTFSSSLTLALQNPTGAGTECMACPAGQASLRGAACNDCEVGRYSNIPGQRQCNMCEAGRMMHADRTSCTNCVPGQYSEADATACVDCEIGTHQLDPGQSRCDQCDMGKIASLSGSTECAPCEVGSYMLPGRTACQKCAAGTYQGQPGRAECFNCTRGSMTASECAIYHLHVRTLYS